MSVTVLAVVVIGCSKSDSGSTVDPNLIIGKWTEVSQISKFTSTSSRTTNDTVYYDTTSYANFVNGKLFQRELRLGTSTVNYDTSNYSISGNTLTTMPLSGGNGGDSYTIQQLTKNSLVIYDKSTSSDGVNETWITGKK